MKDRFDKKVSAEKVETIKKTKKYISDKYVNIREKADPDSKVVSILNPNTLISVHEEVNGFGKIRQGYVNLSAFKEK